MAINKGINPESGAPYCRTINQLKGMIEGRRLSLQVATTDKRRQKLQEEIDYLNQELAVKVRSEFSTGERVWHLIGVQS